MGKEYTFRFLWIFSCLAILVACGPTRTNIVSHPPGYDLDAPRQLNLPVLLNEISGIVYHPQDSSLFAIQDEEGYIYKIQLWHRDSMYRWKFAGPGDFEDIALIDRLFYVLKSNGDVLQCSINDSISTVIYSFPEQGNEFESIYYDSACNRLRLVCKDCAADKKKWLSTYSFDPVSKSFVNDSMRIPSFEIARIENQQKIKFKPSAAAVNPRSGKLYMVSAVNSLLVVANPDGSIDNAYALNKKRYKQPEGIAFAPDGTMFISNEFAGKGVANILIIPYQPDFR